MKVLFVSGEFPPATGGVGHYVAQMASALTRFGHHAVVLTRKRQGLPEVESIGDILVLRQYEEQHLESSGWGDYLAAIAREHKVDLVEGADHLGECAPLLRCSGRPPVLIKVHACQIIKVLQEAHIHYSWQRITWALARFRARKQLGREREVIEHADMEAVCSSRLLDEMHRQGLRVPAKVAVIPNPVRDSGVFEPDGELVPTVLFAGRLEFLKGVQFLPGIMREVLASVPDARLRIAGSDTYARGIGSVKQWLDKRFGAVRSQVDWVGSLNPVEMDNEYRRAWVVLVPSLWDNFPMVVLESMIRGRPIVTTRNGGMPEMLNGTGSVLSAPDSVVFSGEIVRLLTDRAQRKALGLAVRKKALASYTDQAIVPQYVRFVQGGC